MTTMRDDRQSADHVLKRLELEIAVLQANLDQCESPLHEAPLGCPHCKRDHRLLTLLKDVEAELTYHATNGHVDQRVPLKRRA
jgi:hypothetical protein